METIKACPICEGNKLRPFIFCKDNLVSHETFKVDQCESCGFRFTNPRPSEIESGKYYQSEEYVSHSETNKGITNKMYGAIKKYTLRQKVKLINELSERRNNAIKHILDIGCGSGSFLNVCKNDGWIVTGIEPSEIARRNAKSKFGIEPLSAEKLFEIKEKKFDVITLWHVLEHINQLYKTIDQINKVLFDNGTLIVAVPNCNSYDAQKYGDGWAAWDLPRHIYHFTKKDIIAIFNKLGFRLIKTYPMKFDSYYISMLSEKYKHGKTNLIFGFCSGITSNLLANKSNRGYSSEIYILRKT